MLQPCVGMCRGCREVVKTGWQVVRPQDAALCQSAHPLKYSLAESIFVSRIHIRQPSQKQRKKSSLAEKFVSSVTRQPTYHCIYMCRTVSPLNSRTATEVAGRGFNSGVKGFKNDQNYKRLQGMLILARCKGKLKMLPIVRGDAFVSRYIKVGTKIPSKHRHRVLIYY